ncbi:MAG: aminotransferase class I/II-fold pyridoxal phosphate-dependent enzyme [Chitinispirillaceae bacterium]|nr:aminotransferase class I/II-fold pyridoxal phosphate-dependent enzyme [Chitinispirillaceae bacterium]
MPMNPQAAELNATIRTESPPVFDLLSERGKNIYFPKRGILSQSSEAKSAAINATIGTALEEDGSPMALGPLRSLVNMGGTECFNYAPSPGRPEIRKLWKEMMARKNPLLAGLKTSQPVVTSALTHGLSMAGYLFVNDGDAVIVPDLYWENYELAFGNAYGGRLVTFPMFTKDNGFNAAGLASRLREGKPGRRIVLLNFPNNPTGYTVTEAEAREVRNALVEAADAGNAVLVIVDDAYFGLVFEKGILRESMFGLLAGAHERLLVVKLDGPTKEDYVWGFRVGFMTFGTARGSDALYGALEAKLAGAIRGSISNSSNLGQTMLCAAYRSADYEKERAAKYDVLRRRYEKMRDLFAACPEYRRFFRPLPFNSGYFMCIRTSSRIAEPVRRLLLKKYATGVIAPGDDIIRIAFSSTPYDMIEKLLDNIYRAAKEIEKS